MFGIGQPIAGVRFVKLQLCKRKLKGNGSRLDSLRYPYSWRIEPSSLKPTLAWLVGLEDVRLMKFQSVSDINPTGKMTSQVRSRGFGK